MKHLAPLPWTSVKIAWISGVSRPGTRALSPDQLGFIDSLPGDARWKLRTNFPYGLAAEEFRRTTLPVASVVNLTHFVLASQPLRKPWRRRAWRDLRGSCELLLLVTNSCGAQMVQALERESEPKSRLSILSLGSVDWGASRLNRVTVRGSLDRVGVPGMRRADITIDGIGHMDYARSERVRTLACDWASGELRRAGFIAAEDPS